MGSSKSKIIHRQAQPLSEARTRALRYREWHGCGSFSKLPQEGREEIMRWSKGRDNDHRRLLFWYSSHIVWTCEGSPENLEELFSKFLSPGMDMLPEVSMSEEPVDDYILQARELNAYIVKIRDRMKPRLDNVFEEFKEYLAQQIQVLERKS